MKLVVILSRVPFPVEKGDKLRAYHQVRCLSTHHEVHLICLNDAPLHPDAIFELKKFCKSVHIFDLNPFGLLFNLFWAFITERPIQIGYFHRFGVKRRIEALIDELNPNHLYCQLSRTAEYGRDLNISKTIDYQDVFSIGLKRRLDDLPFWKVPFFRMEYERMAIYEETIYHLFDHQTIISLADRDLLPFYERKNVVLIPNGVDFNFFVPEKDVAKRYDLVFTGNMAYPPNIMAVEYLVKKILPLVWAKRPSTNLLIAGTTPHSRVRILSESRILVTGWLKDIRPAYTASRIFIAPMQIGTGLQNKLLEAMAMQLPCITSTLANESLQAKTDTEILVADNPFVYAQHIITLLENEAKATKLAQNGYHFVKSNYDWEAATAILSQLIEE